MPPEDRVRIRHMIEAAVTVQTFIGGRRRADLDTDQMLLFALTRAIEPCFKLPNRKNRKPAMAISRNEALLLRGGFSLA